MDSITHVVVGAAIGDRLLGHKIGRKAAWIGAIASSFPDFDLFISGLNDPRKYILYHRSYTHSFFVELLIALALAYLCYRLFSKKIEYKTWLWFQLICLWCHSLMDWCTNYGTRLLLPFSQQPFALNNIAILDLFLTVPILLIIIVALIFRNESLGRKRLSYSVILYTLIYFGFTFVNKAAVNSPFKNSLAQHTDTVSSFMTNPSILNNILWYGVANTHNQILIGEYSLLQKDKTIHWLAFDANRNLLKNCPSPDARMLEWFSQGYYLCQQNKDTLEVFTLKFGRGDMSQSEAHKTFLFYYKLFQQNGEWKMTSQEPKSSDMKWGEAFQQLYDRMVAKEEKY